MRAKSSDGKWPTSGLEKGSRGHTEFQLGIDDGSKRDLLSAKQCLDRARQFRLRPCNLAAHVNGHHEICAGQKVEGQRD